MLAHLACDGVPGARGGIATQPIAAGRYVHTHNVKSGYLPTYTLP